ncbi:MAG: hypothetical protein QXH24_00095 [Candidatus Bathyarchaeia archaeon]
MPELILPLQLFIELMILLWAVNIWFYVGYKVWNRWRGKKK